jgi:hypothetical protein
VKSLRTYEIVPGLVYQRGKFDGHPLETKKRWLGDCGITHVVCVTNRPDPELQKAMGGGYAHLPIPDGRITRAGSALFLEAAGRFGDILERGGSRALVHCYAGRNRSSLFSALLTMRLLGMSGRRAVSHLRSSRPGALRNPHFVWFLESLLRYDSLLGYVARS